MKIIAYQVIVLPPTPSTFGDRIREYVVYEDGEIMFREAGVWHSAGSAPKRTHSDES